MSANKRPQKEVDQRPLQKKVKNERQVAQEAAQQRHSTRMTPRTEKEQLDTYKRENESLAGQLTQLQAEVQSLRNRADVPDQQIELQERLSKAEIKLAIAQEELATAHEECRKLKKRVGILEAVEGGSALFDKFMLKIDGRLHDEWVKTEQDLSDLMHENKQLKDELSGSRQLITGISRLMLDYRSTVDENPNTLGTFPVGTREAEPLYPSENKQKNEARLEPVKVQVDVDESVVSDNVAKKANRAETKTHKNDISEVNAKVQALTLDKLAAVTGQELALARGDSVEMPSTWAPPVRSFFMSSFVPFSSDDTRTVLNYVALYQDEWEKLRSAIPKKLSADKASRAHVYSLAGLPAAKIFIMWPPVDGVAEPVAVMDVIYELVDDERRKLIEKGETGALPATLKRASTMPYAAKTCSASGCYESPISLVGYCANRVFNMKKSGQDADIEQLRFCEDHVGAVLAHDMCPNCRTTSAPRAGKFGAALSQGVYCLGSEITDGVGNVRHFNHVECMTRVNGKVEWACLHCGNDCFTRFEICRSEGPDWSRKSLCLETEDMTRTHGTLLRRPVLTTTAPFLPVAFSASVYVRSHTITDGGYNVTERTQAAGRPLTQETATPTEKYGMALVSISGQCEGCLCGEVCVPRQCPCMSWYSATKGYNMDHSLRMEDFDAKHDFVRECSETCMCNVNLCVNRATQVPPRVQIRDGEKLVLRMDVHPGDFLFRMAGELNDTKTEKPDGETFLLPKFPLWAPGCENLSLCVKDLQGPARLVRSVEQCRQDNRPFDINVLPVMVLQPPLGIHIGSPRQLAVPVVAFFALRTMQAGVVDLVYEADFRDVNPIVPSLDDLATEAGTDGEPVEATGMLFNPLNIV